MRIFPHFSVVGFCNTYVVGPNQGGDAIIIDPGNVDTSLVRTLTKSNLEVKAVLLTHTHAAHSQGLGTLMKMYDHIEVYAGQNHGTIGPYTLVEDGGDYEVASFKVKALHIPGHSIDSMVYLIDHALFTGDTLEASLVAHTSGYLEKELLIDSIRQRLMTMHPNYLLYPGHGTISKIGIERLFNTDLQRLEIRKFWNGGNAGSF